VAEFIAAVKANPGRLNMASAGIGTPGHLAGELLKIIAGLDLQHVPYRGEGPALTDVIGGQVQSMFSSAAPAIPLIRTGKLRAIAVTTAIRLPSLPDVPSISETIPGYEVSTWAGVGAPRDTPVEIITKLNREINAGLASAAIQAKYADLGYTMFITSPAEFGSSELPISRLNDQGLRSIDRAAVLTRPRKKPRRSGALSHVRYCRSMFGRRGGDLHLWMNDQCSAV
jgi:tripartite-type tricarboxylate transporter receptor subunit TctC